MASGTLLGVSASDRPCRGSRNRNTMHPNRPPADRFRARRGPLRLCQRGARRECANFRSSRPCQHVSRVTSVVPRVPPVVLSNRSQSTGHLVLHRRRMSQNSGLPARRTCGHLARHFMRRKTYQFDERQNVAPNTCGASRFDRRGARLYRCSTNLSYPSEYREAESTAKPNRNSR